MKKRIDLLYVLLIVLFVGMINASHICGQNQSKIDSLKTVLNKKALSAQNQATIYLQLADEYGTKKPSETIVVAQKGINQLVERADYATLGDLYSSLGVACIQMSIHDKAKTCLDSAGYFYRESNNKKGIAKVYANLGVLYKFKYNYKEALVVLQKSIKLHKELGDTLAMARSLNNALGVYTTLKEYDTGLEKAYQIHQIYKEKKNKKGLFAVLYNIENFHSKLHQLDSALYYIEKALLIAKELKNAEKEALTHVKIAIIHLKKKNTKLASESIEQALALKDKINTPGIKIRIQRSVAIYYHQVGLHKKSINAYRIMLDSARQLKDRGYENIAILGLVDNYKKTNQYEKAFFYLKKARTLKDSVLSEGKRKELQDLRVKYETELVTQDNIVLAKENELQTKELEFNKTLNRRNQYIIVGLVFLVLFLVGIGYLVNRQNKLKQALKVMELEQKALKAQIKPHFFFNVLNSLQSSILLEPRMVAYQHHIKFTNLMRLILMQSSLDGILLTEEIETLRLYLELEQLRTDSAFSFTFEIDTQLIDSDPILVPSMMLQPFVENAIWHGIMNRSKQEKKEIYIRVKKRENLIICEIEDTGVGRKKAEMIKQKKSNNHESIGMKVTQDRLSLFEIRYNKKLELSIDDLKDASGIGRGTKVIVQIPKLNLLTDD